jgi:hypothetical protein
VVGGLSNFTGLRRSSKRNAAPAKAIGAGRSKSAALCLPGSLDPVVVQSEISSRARDDHRGYMGLNKKAPSGS